MSDAVFRLIAERLAQGDACFLLTIVETFGSSPRPPGACLALCRDQSGTLRSAGSVSGGCIEAELLQFLAAQKSSAGDTNQGPGQASPPLPAYAAETVFYGDADGGIVDPDSPNLHFNLAGFAPPSGAVLPCGGRMRLLIERFADTEGLEHFERIVAALRTRESLVRHVDTGRQRYELFNDSGHPETSASARHFGFHLYPAWRLLLIGANDVSLRVTSLCSELGFEVTVCEPRDWFYAIAADSREWQALGQHSLLQALPDDLVDAEFADQWSAVLALGHDPRIDDMALIAALQSNAFYVGAMGSERTSEARRARLEELGIAVERLQVLDAPAGFDIGSRTPAEIAVSCVAMLIARRNARLGAGREAMSAVS